MAVETMPKVFSEGSGAGGGREKAASEGRVIGFKGGVNGENLSIMLFFQGPGVERLISPRVIGIINGRDNRIMTRSRLL